MITVDKQVTISNKAGVSFEAHLVGSGDGYIANLELLSVEINFYKIEGYDLLDSFTKLRQLLEEKQLFILCQGSAKNVHTSGMARDMSFGLKAYSLELNKKASLDQLVEIFDPAPIEIVCSIEEQRAFLEKWIASPKY